MVFVGRYSFLWLSGMARARVVGTREVSHRQQGTLAAAFAPSEPPFPPSAEWEQQDCLSGWGGGVNTRAAGSQGRQGRGKRPCGRSPSRAGLLWAQAGMEPAPLSAAVNTRAGGVTASHCTDEEAEAQVCSEG